MKNKRKNIRLNNLFQLLLSLLVIVLLNVIGSYVFTRFDLTGEKRFSLSDETKELLKEIDDIVFFKVYLEGDLPSGFKRLRNETREMLDEFRAYNDNIQYEFINPSENSDARERNAMYQLLVERGLNPTDLQVRTNEGTTQKIIFPGAIVSYKAKESPVELLDSQMGIPPEAVLNNSIQSLEFKLANLVRKLSQVRKPRVAFIEGHGELDEYETADIFNVLSEDYAVERITIDGQINKLTRRVIDSIAPDSLKGMIDNYYEAIIIAKPESAFTEKDKFIIDQYLMYGGSILWLVDPVFASMDSIQNASSTVGIKNELNLDDQLFQYGVRLNADLVMDLVSNQIPLRTGQVGNQPQIDFFPWYYFPLVTPVSQHPIVRNLNAIKTEFVSSIDTISVKGVKKTPLLWTSPYTRVSNAPVFISLNILTEEPDERQYRQPPQAIAYLLEGRFKSLYNGRIPPELAMDKSIGFRTHSEPAKMIVFSDGDIIKNQIHIPQGYPLPLGYDQFTRQTFGNKDLILNALSYIVDGEELISIRSRELKLRLLDKNRITDSEMFWKALNVIAPILLVVLFALIQFYIRKRKYSA